VVPAAAGAHPGLEGPFVTLEFDGEPTLVVLEKESGTFGGGRLARSAGMI
jgi:hypothetical protein